MVLGDDAWGCPIGAGMTSEGSFAALRMTVMVIFKMIMEVLAWGAVVSAGGFVVAAADGFM